MASRERAARGAALLREMMARGLLGTGLETLMQLADLCEYVERSPNPEGVSDAEGSPARRVPESTG